MSGFSKLKSGTPGEGLRPERLDLSDFKPGLSERRGDPKEDEAVADRVAQRRGLAEEPIRRVPLKRGSTVNDKLFISGPLTVLNRFRELCNDTGGTYAEVLERLLDSHDQRLDR